MEKVIIIFILILSNAVIYASDYEKHREEVNSREVIAAKPYCPISGETESSLPNDEDFSKQWYLVNNGQYIKEERTDDKHLDVRGTIDPIVQHLEDGSMCYTFEENTEGADIGFRFVYNNFDDKYMKKDEVVVAVFDRGYNFDNKDINLYYNEPECEKTENVGFRYKGEPNPDDEDGNKYPGDCVGWDFTTRFGGQSNQDNTQLDNNSNTTLQRPTPQPRPPQQRPPQQRPPQQRQDYAVGNHKPDDDHGHGTNVSGLIAAKPNNGLGISSLSNKIKVLPIKINRKIQPKEQTLLQRAREEFYNGKDKLNPRQIKILEEFSLEGVAKRVIQALHYVTEVLVKPTGKPVVDVINMSMSWPAESISADTRKELHSAIQKALDNNIVIVVAAGNNRTNLKLEPCHIKGVICVAASDNTDHFADFTNYGGQVNIVAPGVHIASLYPHFSDDEDQARLIAKEGLEAMSGTSQSAPLVAMAAAAVKGAFYNRDQDEDISPEEVYAHLINKTSVINVKNELTDPFFALNGRVNLKYAFDPVRKPIVEPVFKGLLDIQLSKDGEANLNLPIKNYGQDVKNVFVQLSSNQQALKFKNNPKYSVNIDLNKFEENEISVPIKVTDLNIHNAVTLYVNIQWEQTVNGQLREFSKEFKHIIEFQLPLNDINLSLQNNYSLEIDSQLTKEFNTIDFERGGVNRVVKKIKNYWPDQGFPEYYSTLEVDVTCEEDDSIECPTEPPERQNPSPEKRVLSKNLKLFPFVRKSDGANGSALEQSDPDILIKNVFINADINIQKIPLTSNINNKGYLITYPEYVAASEKNPDQYLRIRFVYFDKNWKPLNFSGYVTKFPYNGELTNPSILGDFEFTFLPHVFEGKEVMIPYLMQAHSVPDYNNDSPPSDFSDSDDGKNNLSLLYFKPMGRDENNDVKFDLQFLFNHSFTKRKKTTEGEKKTLQTVIEDAFKKHDPKYLMQGDYLSSKQQITPIQILPQTYKEFDSKKFKMLVRVNRKRSQAVDICLAKQHHLFVNFKKDPNEDIEMLDAVYLDETLEKDLKTKSVFISPSCQKLRNVTSLNEGNKDTNSMYYFPNINSLNNKSKYTFLGKDFKNYETSFTSVTSDLTEMFLYRKLFFTFNDSNGYEDTVSAESQIHDLGALSFSNGIEKHYYTFSQSFSEINLDHQIVTSSGTQHKSIKQPINYYTVDLLDVRKLKVFKSLSLSSHNRKYPALLVNNSDIKKGHFFVWTYDHKELKSPISLNLNIPETCSSLNPEITDDNGTYSMIFLCKNPENNNWSLKTVPIRL